MIGQYLEPGCEAHEHGRRAQSVALDPLLCSAQFTHQHNTVNGIPVRLGSGRAAEVMRIPPTEHDLQRTRHVHTGAPCTPRHAPSMARTDQAMPPTHAHGIAHAPP